jgi:hypothetical protein
LRRRLRRFDVLKRHGMRRARIPDFAAGSPVVRQCAASTIGTRTTPIRLSRGAAKSVATTRSGRALRLRSIGRFRGSRAGDGP